MPKYELEDGGHSEVDPSGDLNLEDSTHPEIESKEEDTLDESLEVSSEEDGAPEELEAGDQTEVQDELLDNEVEENDLDSLVPDKALPDLGAFDLGNGLNLKVGDKITSQHLHELNRGYQREAEFTRKCQELAPIRDQANEILQNFNHVIQSEFTNPALIFNYMTPEHAIRGLAAIGLDIDPELLKSIGYGNSYQSRPHQGHQGQVDPYVQRELAEHRAWREQQEKEKYTSALDAEVRAEIADIKNPKIQKNLWRNILTAALYSPQKSIRQIAIEERQALREQFESVVKAKKSTRERGRVGRTTGSSRPVTSKRPDTWEAADRSAMGRLNAR